LQCHIIQLRSHVCGEGFQAFGIRHSGNSGGVIQFAQIASSHVIELSKKFPRSNTFNFKRARGIIKTVAFLHMSKAFQPTSGC